MIYSPSFLVTCGECVAETRVLGAYKSGLSWKALQARVRERLALRGWRCDEGKDVCPRCAAEESEQ